MALSALLQEQLPEIAYEAVPNSAETNAEALASQKVHEEMDLKIRTSAVRNQVDEEPEVDTRCETKVCNPMHLTRNLPLPWSSGEDSPTTVLKPRLTLSAFRKPAANMTQCDPTRILEDFYDLSQAGCSGVLGHGAFSTVRLAVRTSDSLPVAVKSIAKHEALRSRRLRVGRNLEEWEILQKMKGHEFVIQLLDIFETDEEIQLVMEFCRGGELFNAIQRKRNRNHSKRRGQYTEEQAACITSQILRALSDLHAAGIVHRDVKLENILLASEDENSVRVKLCDLGTARSLDPVSPTDGSQRRQGDISPLTPGRSRSNSVIGSSYYGAPELTCGSYDTSVDVYSLGVTLYILLCGFPPVFTGSEGDQVTFPSFYWNDISPEAKDLVRKMLNPDASERITAHEALRDVWIWKHRDSIQQELSANTATLNGGKVNLDLVRKRLSKSLDRPRKKRSRSSAASASMLMSPKRARLSGLSLKNNGGTNNSNTGSSASSALMALADLYRDVAQSPSAKVISSVVSVEAATAADPSAFVRSPALPTLSV
mmetsp:Transcript_24012/g.49902  ORF Transcript_24012/g.49902 Transcript_24012/m.49902 type:complete len:541 (-) Transcript_24012:262-1884(-)